MKLQQALIRLGRRMRAAAAEATYADRRATALACSYDRLLPHPDDAPADYGEFLLRTSGPLLHEPSARRRAAGHPCGLPAGGGR